MIRKLLALILLATPLAANLADAQAKGRPDPRFVQPEQIDPSEGTQILTAFRSARTRGDYAFAFDLINRPYGKTSITYHGRMVGTWDAENHAITRSDIAIENASVLRLIYIGGPDGIMIRSTDDNPAEQITGEARFKPIIDGLTFTPFDLQMPFLFWTDYIYEGTRKLLGRPAHYFILYPPKTFENDELGAVRVAVDADFLVMLMAEELDQSGNVIKAFRINGFEKVDNQWIVKEIDLVDERTKDRTRFKVIDASVGLEFPAKIFIKNARGTIDAISVPNTKDATGKN